MMACSPNTKITKRQRLYLLTGSTLFVRISYDEGSEEEEEKDGLTTP
jgi:hypothetical protein